MKFVRFSCNKNTRPIGTQPAKTLVIEYSNRTRRPIKKRTNFAKHYNNSSLLYPAPLI